MIGISKGSQEGIYPTKKESSRIVFVLLILIFGLVFLGFGIYSLTPNKYDKYGIETTATIIAVRHNNGEYPIVSYEVNGVTYESELSEYDITMKVGKKINIRYMEENPLDFTLAKGQSLFPYFAIPFGSLIVISSILIFISNAKKSLKKLEKIKNDGSLVECYLTDITLSNITMASSAANGYLNSGIPTSIKITCKDDNGNYYIQKNFTNDIAINYNSKTYGYILGDHINVYISNKNKNKYIIDVIEYKERKLTELYKSHIANKVQINHSDSLDK